MGNPGRSRIAICATWTFDLANRRTHAALANGVTSVFDFDINDRLTHIRHAKDTAGLFEVSYGYDAAGGRRYTRDMLATDHSELYTHDARDRLTAFGRGTLNAEATAITALNDAVLPSAQDWGGLDKRGNWLDSSLTVDDVTTAETIAVERLTLARHHRKNRRSEKDPRHSLRIENGGAACAPPRGVFRCIRNMPCRTTLRASTFVDCR